MADRKISDLTALTTPASGDYLPIVDISETAASGKNKRITIGELLRGAPDGTAAAPGIAFESDPDSGLYSPGANQVAISTNGNGRLFIASDGKVGIATTSPGELLDISPTTESGAILLGRIPYATYGSFLVGNGTLANHVTKAGNSTANVASSKIDFSNGPIIFSTSPGAAAGVARTYTETARIDSSGRFLVGTSTTLSTSSGHIIQAANSTGVKLSLGRSATSVATGVVLASLNGYSNGGSVYEESGNIQIVSDGTHASGDKPGRLVFSTTPDGLSTPTERMRITQAGGIKASTSGSYAILGSASSHEFVQSDAGVAAFHAYHTASSGTPHGYYFKFSNLDPNDATSYVFTAVDNTNANIYTINSNGTVSARSDAKFKKNIETARDGYLDDLVQLRVVKYNWYNHDDGTPKELGFIAQEVEQVFPGLVSTIPDKDNQGNETGEVSKSIKTSVFTPMLVKALQEAVERIETLEAKVAALESA